MDSGGAGFPRLRCFRSTSDLRIAREVTRRAIARHAPRVPATGAAEKWKDSQMTMTFDAAICEYLHRTDHPRPWTRRQEEDALDGLAGWLRATAGSVALQTVTPQMVSSYAAVCRLAPEEVDDLHGTLAGLRLWARAAGVDGTPSESSARRENGGGGRSFHAVEGPRFTAGAGTPALPPAVP
jgi:hypothetical protein